MDEKMSWIGGGDYQNTVYVVEGTERCEQLEEGEAVLKASLFDGRSRKDHHNGSDLLQ